MLHNTLSMLLYWTRANVQRPAEAPVFYQHKLGKDNYQVIVQKMPEQEAMAA